jgi:hypothetical protein
MMRTQIEVRTGKGQAGNQLAAAGTGKGAASERPETNIDPARPRRACGSIRSQAILHGRALIVGPTVPNGIITLGCSVALGLSGGKGLKFRAIARRHLRSYLGRGTGDSHFNAALQRRTGFLSFTFVGNGSITADRIPHLGTDRDCSSLARILDQRPIDRSHAMA